MINSNEFFQAVAELPEEVISSEVMKSVLENVEEAISHYSENRLEDAASAFNEALRYVRKIRARKVEYHIVTQLKSVCYELGRPPYELKHLYR